MTIRTLVLLAGLGATPAAAQTLGVTAARWFNAPHVGTVSVSVGAGGGSVRLLVTGQGIERSENGRESWYGGGLDVLLRPHAGARPYLIGGAGLGLGRTADTVGRTLSLAWSAGLGYELVGLGPLGLQAEARYNRLPEVGLNAISLGLRAGTRIGRRDRRASPPPTVAWSGPVPVAPAGAAVELALQSMGAPYRWGGSDENGFDCSGLIQYAYARQGIALPRRSVDQARSGREVGRDPSALSPGDILTFAAGEGGGPVSHVGLYVGEGRFIHSARGGVQVSRFDPADQVGRWWWRRWVGARRVVE